MQPTAVSRATKFRWGRESEAATRVLPTVLLPGDVRAVRSARLALSQAAWLGIDRDVAIQAVFEMGLDGFFRANPHIPIHTWQSVTEQIACPDECALVAA